MEGNVLFDLEEVLNSGKIQNELEYERAKNANNRLRILSKNYPDLKLKRNRLFDLIEAYENEHWSFDKEIDNAQIEESDIAEEIAGKEQLFVNGRKELIRTKLKEFSITQQDLGKILGHKSKSYMSELMNGIYPFSLKDLVIIHRLFKIELSALIATTLSQDEDTRIRASIKRFDRPGLTFSG